MIYAASSLSLAAMEILVHAETLPVDYSWAEIRIPDGVSVESLDVAQLPKDWMADPPSAETRRIGQKWVVTERSAVLRVPSSVVPMEWNYLLNPRHVEFGRIVFSRSKAFRFDPRLRPAR